MSSVICTWTGGHRRREYGAEPDDGTSRSSVDEVGAGRLEADIEGMSIAYGADGAGYHFESNQGGGTSNLKYVPLSSVLK